MTETASGKIVLPPALAIPDNKVIVDRYMWCLRARNKDGRYAIMFRLNDNGYEKVAEWKGDTKMPPWVKAKGESL